MCKLKIAKSTEAPEWLKTLLRGGYAVHPIPGPCSTKALNNNKIIPMGNTQKLMLFIRGNAMSGLPIITGTYQFPNPPIKAGITTKNNINNPCAVIYTL
jgi:hypothetical protein